MTNTKHTPGPLRLVEDTFDGGWIVLTGDNSLQVATFDNKADAVRFVASADLLAACEAGLFTLCDYIDDAGYSQDEESAVELMRAAIAKAKGRRDENPQR